MNILPYALIAVAGVTSGVLSGISGGGGGMLMIPVFILVGLPPQHAVATGKMNGLGASFGGLAAFAKTGNIRKDILKVMIPIAIVVGIVTPFVFSAFESKLFQIILGVILLLLVPTLFLKKKEIVKPTKKRRMTGFGAYTGVITLQALFGTGVGSLALFVMTLLFGTTKIEANATKRAVTAVLTPITFVALFLSGYVALAYGLVGLSSVFIGTHIGSKIALQKGEKFVSYAMAAIVSISALALIFTAR